MKEYMTNRNSGVVIMLAALGMMMGLVANDISELPALTMEHIVTPTFIGALFAHFAAVIAAFVAGRLTSNVAIAIVDKE